MQEEMQQFINQEVWKLVSLPAGKFAIGTKWILKNKRDARGIFVRNKARLVAQGHRKEEGIDYDEVLSAGGISTGSDSAGSMPAGSSSASGYPAGGVPAGGEKPAGSTEPA
nr:ribonuclease H-like domain-containing protein [Tanacetum cinerariifolium]